MQKVPKIRVVREPEKLLRYVTPEDFSLLYHDAAELAEIPVISGRPYKPDVWWKGLARSDRD